MRMKAISKQHKNVGARIKLSYILQTTHLIPCLTATTFTLVIALLSGQRWQILILFPMVLLGQFTIGWSNDYLDRDRDRKAGRLDKPIAMDLIGAVTIRNIAVVGFIVSCGLGFVYGRAAGAVYLAAMVSALAYNFWLKHTAFSLLSPTLSFALLPVVVGLGASTPQVVAAWMIVACASLGAGVHIINVIPDFVDDAATGIKGTIHYLSYAYAVLFGGLVLVGSSMAVAIGTYNKAVYVSAFIAVVTAITASAFVRQYMHKNYQAAFAVSAKTLIVTMLIVLSGAPYMLK